MDHEDDKRRTPALARSGHEEEHGEDGYGEQEGHGVDGLRRCGEEDAEERRPLPEDPIDPDLVEADQVANDLVYYSSWKGLLPPPETMRQYDPDVQRRIVEWAEDSNRRTNALADSAVAADAAESRRQDKLVDHQVRMDSRAQTMTFVIYGALLVIGAIAAVAGYQYLAGLSIGSFSVVSVGKMVVDHIGKR